MRKVGGPVRFLADSAFRSQAVLYAEAVQSLASRARLAEELASGQAQDTRPIGNLNPQGTIGVDLSGPPWGSAILHPIATCGGRNSTAGMTGERHAVDGITTSEKTIGPWNFWNRPHARLPYPSVAPYSRLHFAFRGYVASGANVTLTLRFRVMSLQDGSILTEESENFTLSTTETSFLSSTAYFQGCPGGHCSVSIGAVQSGTTDEVLLTSFSLLLQAKRSH